MSLYLFKWSDDVDYEILESPEACKPKLDNVELGEYLKVLAK